MSERGVQSRGSRFLEAYFGKNAVIESREDYDRLRFYEILEDLM